VRVCLTSASAGNGVGSNGVQRKADRNVEFGLAKADQCWTTGQSLTNRKCAVRTGECE